MCVIPLSWLPISSCACQSMLYRSLDGNLWDMTSVLKTIYFSLHMTGALNDVCALQVMPAWLVLEGVQYVGHMLFLFLSATSKDR